MPRTSKEKFWIIGATVVGLLLLVIGYFMFISSQNSQTSSVRASVSAAQQRNDSARARVNSLQQQFANIAKYEADLAQAKLALPDTSGMPDFLRTLQALGSATQTSITSLSVSPPTPLTGSGSATSSSSSQPPANSSSGSSAGAPVYGMSITMTVSGGTRQLGEFLTQLQSVQPRAVLISSVISTQSGSSNAKGGSTLSVSMQAFVEPEAK